MLAHFADVYGDKTREIKDSLYYLTKEKVRAKICLLAGDTAGCFAALEAAKVAGWNAREVLLWEESAQISDLPEFARLLEGADGEGAWNVQLMPELPAVEE